MNQEKLLVARKLLFSIHTIIICCKIFLVFPFFYLIFFPLICVIEKVNPSDTIIFDYGYFLFLAICMFRERRGVIINNNLYMESGFINGVVKIMFFVVFYDLTVQGFRLEYLFFGLLSFILTLWVNDPIKLENDILYDTKAKRLYKLFYSQKYNSISKNDDELTDDDFEIVKYPYPGVEDIRIIMWRK